MPRKHINNLCIATINTVNKYIYLKFIYFIYRERFCDTMRPRCIYFDENIYFFSLSSREKEKIGFCEIKTQN